MTDIPYFDGYFPNVMEETIKEPGEEEERKATEAYDDIIILK